jgi:hypothetical protein
MNSLKATLPFKLKGELIFRLFKYLIYALLSSNLVLFYLEDSAAAAEIYHNGVALVNIIEAYSATIDSASWVVLLLVFELETAILSDERLRGWLGYTLSTLKAVCYVFILYSLYGYVLKFGLITAVSPSEIIDLCQHSNQGWTFISSLNEYFPVTDANCVKLGSEPLFQINNTHILGHAEHIQLLYNLSGLDVINAAAWVVLVITLQTEVILQLRNGLDAHVMGVSKWIKRALYAVLFSAAVYWGIDGTFLDFWDAFLWLVAFVFIDMNILSWHEEVQEEMEQAQA